MPPLTFPSAASPRRQPGALDHTTSARGRAPGPVPDVQAVERPEVRREAQDIVGLYINPPAHAVVLSVDEKSQIQALDRTQPGLPMKPGRAGTMTHDYKRN